MHDGLGMEIAFLNEWVSCGALMCPLPERSFPMIRSLLSVTVSAFVVGSFSTSADAAQVWVRSTNLGGGLTESFV